MVGDAPAADIGSFEDAVGAFDRICAQAKEALNKAAGALRAVHQIVLPQSAPPATIQGLADALGPGASALADFARTQLVGGSESTFLLLLGHGVAGDFEKAIMGFTKKPDGKSAVTSAMKAQAGTLSKRMVEMMEAHAAARAERSRVRSESTS